MRQRILIIPLLMILVVALLEGQGREPKVEVVKYPVPGSEDATARVASAEARKVLDDFYQSKVLLQEHEDVLNSDANGYGRVIADRQVEQDERFGKGEDISKAQVLANFRSGKQHMTTHQHDHVRLVAFGENTVVVTGHSTSVLHHDGKLSNGSRLLTEVWMKLDGRWQRVVHCMSDIEGMEDRANP